MVIQVVAGRNIAVLVEAAVRNTIPQLRGIDTYQEFVERHRRAMERAATTENLRRQTASRADTLAPWRWQIYKPLRGISGLPTPKTPRAAAVPASRRPGRRPWCNGRTGSARGRRW